MQRGIRMSESKQRYVILLEFVDIAMILASYCMITAMMPSDTLWNLEILTKFSYYDSSGCVSMKCANPACDRSVFSSCNPHNLTQHSFCSLYCYRYVTDGYKLVPKSENKHHRNQVKYPVIESHCDSCGNLRN